MSKEGGSPQLPQLTYLTEYLEGQQTMRRDAMLRRQEREEQEAARRLTDYKFLTESSVVDLFQIAARIIGGLPDERADLSVTRPGATGYQITLSLNWQRYTINDGDEDHRNLKELCRETNVAVIRDEKENVIGLMFNCPQLYSGQRLEGRMITDLSSESLARAVDDALVDSLHHRETPNSSIRESISFRG